MSKKSTKPHLLEPIVRAAFAEREQHDALSLTYYFTGDACVKPLFKAYRAVVEDVLGTMEDQGLLTRDRVGWYYLVTPAHPAVKEFCMMGEARRRRAREPGVTDNPDVVICHYDDLAAAHAETASRGIVLCIGERGRLAPADMLRAVSAWRAVLQINPACLLLHVGGYDDDLRELWDIPDVRRYVVNWAIAAGVEASFDLDARTFLAFLVVCSEREMLARSGARDCCSEGALRCRTVTRNVSPPGGRSSPKSTVGRSHKTSITFRRLLPAAEQRSDARYGAGGVKDRTPVTYSGWIDGLDHLESYRVGRRPVALVTMPYGYASDCEAAVPGSRRSLWPEGAYAAVAGLRLVVSGLDAARRVHGAGRNRSLAADAPGPDLLLSDRLSPKRLYGIWLSGAAGTFRSRRSRSKLLR